MAPPSSPISALSLRIFRAARAHEFYSVKLDEVCNSRSWVAVDRTIARLQELQVTSALASGTPLFAGAFIILKPHSRRPGTVRA
jgi:hypothetical protein